LLRKEGIDKPLTVVLAKARLDGHQFGADEIADAFELWQDDERKQAWERLRSRLRYQPQLAEPIETWVRAVTGDAKALDVAVVRHFVWQVKRKLYGLPVERHLMPVVTGAQRGGKSTAVRKLISPVADYVYKLESLTSLEDERQNEPLTTCLVVFADEMTRSRKVDMAALKSKISTDTLQWRVLATHHRAQGPMMATFIGTANPELADLIVDETGMGRFAEIKAQAKVDWEAINGIDYVALWMSVDEQADAPIKSYLDQLGRAQEAARTPSPVEEYVHTRYQRVDGFRTTARDLFNAYLEWMHLNHRAHQAVTETKFGRDLVTLFGKDVKRKVNGIIQYSLARRATPIAWSPELDERITTPAATVANVIPISAAKGFGIARLDDEDADLDAESLNN
jgi:hypothetical protein